MTTALIKRVLQRLALAADCELIGVPRYTKSIQTLEALGFEPSARFAVSHDDACDSRNAAA